MDISLDDKRIEKILYRLEDGRTVCYNFENGELLYVSLAVDGNEIPTDREMIDKAEKLNLARYKNRIKNMISDSEMIQRIRNSEFMDELEDARKRFKIDKEIVDGFPEKDDIYRENQKRSEDKCSDESLKVAQEIIKMDREGKLDEFLKRHSTNYIDKFIREEIESPLRDSELADDSAKCQRNMDTIEQKILTKLRMSEGDVTKDDDFEKLVENYNFYKEKKKELDDKIWADIPKVAPGTCIPVKEAKPSVSKELCPLKKVEVKTTPINPEIVKTIRPLNELK